MYAYIARQPILNQYRETVAYELLYRDGSGNKAKFADGDAATKAVLNDAVNLFGFRQLTDGLPAYINFTRNLLLNGFARQSDPNDIIIQVMEDAQMDEAMELALRRLRQDGYTLALKNYTGQDRFHEFLQLFHIVRVDFRRTNVVFQRDAAQNQGAPGMLFLADKIERESDFDNAVKMGYDLFQGYLFEKPFCLFKRLPPLAETAYGQILSTLLNVTPEVPWEVICARIIHGDFMLSYLFRLEERAMNFRQGRNVDEIRASVYRMGPHHVRHWACLALMRQHNVTGSDALIRRACQRGRFMEALAASSTNETTVANRGNAFLLGALSLMDKVTGNNLEYLLRGMDLPQSMRDALLGRGDNDYTRLLQYAVIYEMGNSRLILPNIHTRLGGADIINLHLKCMADADAAIARMEDSPI